MNVRAKHDVLPARVAAASITSRLLRRRCQAVELRFVARTVPRNRQANLFQGQLIASQLTRAIPLKAASRTSTSSALGKRPPPNESDDSLAAISLVLLTRFRDL